MWVEWKDRKDSLTGLEDRVKGDSLNLIFCDIRGLARGIHAVNAIVTEGVNSD